VGRWLRRQDGEPIVAARPSATPAEAGADRARSGRRRKGVRNVKGSSLAAEIGQSFVLMGLMAVMLTLYLGAGLLVVRVLG
jgi:hypothetical protein